MSRMESPFVTVSKILSEPSNGLDDLRIIADSGTRLDTPTRELILAAALEMENNQRLLWQMQEKLTETLARMMALNDQLLAARALIPYSVVEVTYAKVKR
jgi:hypothetical protein